MTQPSGDTLAVEKHVGCYFLMAVDVHGIPRVLATFHSASAAKVFKDALVLAKASAHAAGASGI